MAIKGTSNDPAQGVYARLKFEGGVHRVQRVPVTESQGRIHTSAAGVLVLPEVDEPEELDINQNDLKIDVYRSSGPGGQSVNTTDSAVRITHLPTGIVVAMQNEKSQLQNREAGMRVLRARILAHQQEQIDAEIRPSASRRSARMDRSERIRTYNYPENRIADHRTGYKAYNLDQVMNGDLEPMIQSAITPTNRRGSPPSAPTPDSDVTPPRASAAPPLAPSALPKPVHLRCNVRDSGRSVAYI